MESTADYEALKEAIARAYPDMWAQLQRITRYALEKPADFALGTVAGIAGVTRVQPSAMIRFANSLGYRGFSEMQQVFRGHLVKRSASSRQRIHQLRRRELKGLGALASVATCGCHSPEVIEAASSCSARGVTVIAITEGPLSPLAACAKVCFELAGDSSRLLRCLVAPMCLAQALATSTGNLLAEIPESVHRA